jgi:hypothetical protein
MKSIKDFRSKQQSFDSEDSMRRASKLEPIKKSGKEKHSLYSRLDDDDDDDDVELRSLRKRESAYDYFDDGEESDEEFDDDLDDEDDEEWDEEDEEADEEESDDAER